MHFFKKRIAVALIVLMGMFCSYTYVRAVPLWQNVGSATFTAGGAQYTSVALSSTGTPFIAFEDGANGDKLTVMNYNGSSWNIVGTAGFSAGSMFGTSLVMSPSNTPYVAYFDDANGDKATVMRYNGTSWVAVGSAGFTPNRINSLAFALDASSTPYVAYEDFTTNKANVMKYDGMSWVAVGGVDFSTGTASNISLAFSPTGTPYVAFSDGDIGDKTTVMRYNGSSWVVVGSAGITGNAASYNSLALSSTGTVYLASGEGAAMSPQKANVRMFNGTSWVAVGAADFSAGDAPYINIIVSPRGALYVGYQDQPNSFKATVSTFNGTSWVAVGAADFSAGSSQYNSLALSSDNKLYMGYQDGGFGGGATVMNYVLPSEPGQVTGLALTLLGSTRMGLSWTAPSPGSSAITGYQIERETPVGGGFATVSSTATTSISFIDTGLVASTTYNYRVSAINSVGTSTPSAAAATTTPYTRLPTLSSPLAASAHNNTSTLAIGYSLPMAMLSGSLRLSFIPASGTPITLTLADVIAGSHTLNLIPAGGVQTAVGVVSSSADVIPDGLYTVSLSYQDSYGDPAASASVSNVLIKPAITAAPTLMSPASSQSYTDTSVLSIDYTLPIAALTNSVIVRFSPTTGTPITLVLPDESVGRHVFTLTPVSGILSRPVKSASADSIPDNTYTVSFSYQDVYGNPSSTVYATGVIIAPPVVPTSTPTVTYSGGGSGTWFFSPLSVSPTAPTLPFSTTSVSTTPRLFVVTSSVSESKNLVTNPPSLSCTTPLYLKKPIRYGARNNPADVKLLQDFLNTYQRTNLPLDGVYSKKMFNAVVSWQEQNAARILTPWGLTKGTGYVYTNSLREIQKIVTASCPDQLAKNSSLTRR